MKKIKLITVVGTRPEIIRLSRIIPKLDKYFDHLLIHTGQNYDYELNEIFFEQLELRKPDIFLNAAGKSSSETIGNVIISDKTSFRIQANVGGYNIKNIIFEDLDVSSIPMILNLNCYPNHANSFINIKWNSDYILSTDVDIYSISGAKVFSKKLISEKGDNQVSWYLKSIDYKSVPSGVYIVKVKTSNELSIKKFTYLK